MRVDINSLLQQIQALDPKHQALIAQLTNSLTQTTTAGITTPDLRPYFPPWLQHLANKGFSRGTITVYRIRTAALLRSFPAPTPIDIDTYLTLQSARVKTTTIFLYAAAFRSFFSYLQERGINTVLPDDIPKVKYPRHRRLAPPPEHVLKLLTYPKLKPHVRAFLYLLVDSGPRISEVLQLRRKDIDLTNRRVELLGKGNKQRIIPISDRTADAIRTLLSASTSNYLFPGKGRHITWTPHAAETVLERLCHKVGIPPFTPHQLRHFFATQAINSGANIRSVSEILGHKNPSITLDVYCHTNQELNAREHANHSPLSKMLEKKEVD